MSKPLNISYLRKHRSIWYLIPEKKIKEWDAYMDVFLESNSEDWFIYADKFEETFRRHTLATSLENLRILTD